MQVVKNLQRRSSQGYNLGNQNNATFFEVTNPKRGDSERRVQYAVHPTSVYTFSEFGK